MGRNRKPQKPTPRKARELKVTRGGRKIVKFMAKRKLSVTEFAAAASVDRVSVHRATNGERWEFITVDFALGCRDATDGYIQVEDFAKATALPLGETGEEEDPFARKKTGTDG